MRTLPIILLTAPLAMFSAATMAGDAAAGAEKAEVCLDCHEPSDFEGLGADEIAGMIKGVVAGEVKHPGVELAEEDIGDVAAYFAAEAAKDE
jgi:cytochrome c553